MAALEKHYTVAEVAVLWSLSEETIRKLFRDDPSVLKIGVGEKLHKRGYVVLRIPESVVLRTHEKLRGPR